MRLLDTAILIDVQRGYEPAVRWFESLDELPTVPGDVEMELYAGCRNALELRQVENLLAPLPKAYPTPADQARAVATFRELRLRNNIGAVDVRIAELAKGLDGTLCSTNEKHFKAVPGLKLEVPYGR